MPRILISYRRQDSEDCSGRIRDRLVVFYGPSEVFMDVHDIPYGTDYRDYIADQIAHCEVVLAVIGPKWPGQVNDGKPRLAEPDDPVRVELETAFRMRRRIVPVLVSGARMAQPADLPETLRGLSYLNAATVGTGADFHPNMDRLIAKLQAAKTLAVRRAAIRRAITGFSLKRPLGRVAAVVGITIIAGSGAYANWEWLFPSPDRPPAVILLPPKYEADQSVRNFVNDIFGQIWAHYFDGLSKQQKFRAIPDNEELQSDGSRFKRMFFGSESYSSAAVLRSVGTLSDIIRHRVERLILTVANSESL